MVKPTRKLLLFTLVNIAFFIIAYHSNFNDSVGQPVVAQSLSKVPTAPFTIAASTNEGFESGTKTSYAGADITLSTGLWNLNDALIGNTTSDRKSGIASVRVRYSGKITMKFNRTTGAGTVAIKHAKYGSDASSTWGLWFSTNSGSSWAQIGSTVRTSSTTLQTASFAVNKTGTIRFEIRKTDGTSSRINVDDISIPDYSGTTPPVTGNVNLTMGNPSGAAVNVNYPSNYLLDKPQFCASYNRDKGIANWVSWQLNSSWCNGSAVRKDNFIPDAALPTGWYRVTTTDYTGSGFSRGHMCPSADRLNTQANNDAIFVMTNMVPQNQVNNGGPWEDLESYCRSLANAGNVLYIICGPNGSGGTGTNGTATMIAGGKVSVPAKLWKVVLVLSDGSNDVSRVKTSTRTIAIITNNNSGPFSNWGTYRVSIDQIEALTGYDFFSNVPTPIQSVIEAKVDNGPTQ